MRKILSVLLLLSAVACHAEETEDNNNIVIPLVALFQDDGESLSISEDLLNSDIKFEGPALSFITNTESESNDQDDADKNMIEMEVIGENEGRTNEDNMDEESEYGDMTDDSNKDKTEAEILKEQICMPRMCPRIYLPVCAIIDNELKTMPSACEYSNMARCEKQVRTRMGRSLPDIRVLHGGMCNQASLTKLIRNKRA